jgi:hypothetical protein
MSAYFSVALATLLMVGVCAFGILRGGRAERAGSVCILAANVLAEVAICLNGPKYPGAIIFALDFALALALLVVAVRYSSLWLGAAMILQSVALYAHSVMVAGNELSYRLYVVLNDNLTFLMLGCIAVSTLCRMVSGQRSSAGALPPVQVASAGSSLTRSPPKSA